MHLGIRERVSGKGEMLVEIGFYARILLSVAMVIPCCDGERNGIRIEGGGYENLVIAIQKGVPENKTVIQQLKVNIQILYVLN